MVEFDRPPFKIFTLRFSNKSVQAPSCERPRTAQRTVFLSFEINNFFPNSSIMMELYEKIRETFMPRGEFKQRYWVFAETYQMIPLSTPLFSHWSTPLNSCSIPSWTRLIKKKQYALLDVSSLLLLMLLFSGCITLLNLCKPITESTVFSAIYCQT